MISAGKPADRHVPALRACIRAGAAAPPQQGKTGRLSTDAGARPVRVLHPRHPRPMMVDHRSMSRSELRASGLSRQRIDQAVAAGTIVRPRRNVYLAGSAPDEIVRAVRVGGRLTCLSLLAMLGVFVMENDSLHVHMSGTSSRMRSPHDRRTPLQPRRMRRSVRLHWLPAAVAIDRAATCADIVDALVHSVLCQAPRAAIATFDSALNKGLIGIGQLADVFGALPPRFAALRQLVDGRAESGPETLMRLMLRGLGVQVQLQVDFHGIGRVDLLVDGWLVIECDSAQFHSGWETHQRDRARDLALAARGLTTLRPTAADIMWRPETVLAAVRGLLAARAALLARA